MVILLDIDGVMVPANSWRQPVFKTDGFPEFSSIAVKSLQHILSATNASVVLTTSHKATFTLTQWLEIFDARGINLVNIDRLDTNSLEVGREAEIIDWHERHSYNRPFVIIDDDKRLNNLPADVKAHFVLTQSSIGLTIELADKAISILHSN